MQKEQHLDKKSFDDNQVAWKPSSQIQSCKFSGRPKYDMRLKKPNTFNADWIYSVPCGQTDNKEDPCPSWIFLFIPEEICDTHKRKVWVAKYLDSLDWVEVTNASNKRFVCPTCAMEKM